MVREEQARCAVDRYTGPLMRLGYSYLRNTADAQDVCQTVLMKLLTENHQFESDEHEKAWVLCCAANLCKNILKSPWKKRTCPMEEWNAWTEGLEEPDGQVMEAVKALPAKYRVVIDLYYYEGYGAKEIGEILNISQNAVYTRLARAREKLKWELEGMEYEETV